MDDHNDALTFHHLQVTVPDLGAWYKDTNHFGVMYPQILTEVLVPTPLVPYYRVSIQVTQDGVLTNEAIQHTRRMNRGAEEMRWITETFGLPLNEYPLAEYQQHLQEHADLTVGEVFQLEAFKASAIWQNLEAWILWDPALSSSSEDDPLEDGQDDIWPEEIEDEPNSEGYESGPEN